MQEPNKKLQVVYFAMLFVLLFLVLLLGLMTLAFAENVHYPNKVSASCISAHTTLTHVLGVLRVNLPHRMHRQLRSWRRVCD